MMGWMDWTWTWRGVWCWMAGLDVMGIARTGSLGLVWMGWFDLVVIYQSESHQLCFYRWELD